MKSISYNKLKEMLYNHELWLNCRGGKKINLSYTDLRYVDLRYTDLRYANLSYTDLRYVDLRYTDLSYTDLSGADLRHTDLSNADLSYSNLSNADLRCADLSNIKINYRTLGYHLDCPGEGSFIGYKKANKHLIKLLILEDSKRSSATTLKCRCDKAKVLSITNIKTGKEISKIASDYDKNFIYEVGKIVEVKDFDEDRWNECSTGIHFFINKESAINY